jgi:hypothetical protein
LLNRFFLSIFPPFRMVPLVSSELLCSVTIEIMEIEFPQAYGNTIYLNLRLVYHPRRFTTAEASESKNRSVSSFNHATTRSRCRNRLSSRKQTLARFKR